MFKCIVRYSNFYNVVNLRFPNEHFVLIFYKEYVQCSLNSSMVSLLNKNISYLTSADNHYIVFHFHLPSSERLAQCSDNIYTHTTPPGSKSTSGKHSALLPATSPTTIRPAWMFCRIVSVLTFDLFGRTDYVWPLRISCLLRLVDVFCIIINRLTHLSSKALNTSTYTKLERVADWLTNDTRWQTVMQFPGYWPVCFELIMTPKTRILLGFTQFKQENFCQNDSWLW